MGNTQAGDPEAPAETSDEAPPEAPGETDETNERSLGWYAAVVAITTGIFGALLGIGLNLLPTATLDEKSLVIGACLALAAASFIGVGAWQSARRFAATAAVTALAIVSLAVLAIAADLSGAAEGQADGPLSGASTGPSGSGTSQSSAPSGTDYVSGNLQGDPGQGQPGPDDGIYHLGGIGYVRSLGYPALCRLDASGPLKVTYPLSSPYRYLTAELGLTDAYPQKGENEQATFEVDEGMNNGSSKENKQVTVHYGHPVRFTWNIEGAATVTLLTHGSDCIIGSVAVWGNVLLVPLP